MQTKLATAPSLTRRTAAAAGQGGLAEALASPAQIRQIRVTRSESPDPSRQVRIIRSESSDPSRQIRVARSELSDPSHGQDKPPSKRRRRPSPCLIRVALSDSLIRVALSELSIRVALSESPLSESSYPSRLSAPPCPTRGAGQGRHRGVGGGAQGPGQRSLSYIILYYII